MAMRCDTWDGCRRPCRWGAWGSLVRLLRRLWSSVHRTRPAVFLWVVAAMRTHVGRRAVHTAAAAAALPWLRACGRTTSADHERPCPRASQDAEALISNAKAKDVLKQAKEIRSAVQAAMSSQREQPQAGAASAQQPAARPVQAGAAAATGRRKIPVCNVSDDEGEGGAPQPQAAASKPAGPAPKPAAPAPQPQAAASKPAGTTAQPAGQAPQQSRKRVTIIRAESDDSDEEYQDAADSPSKLQEADSASAEAPPAQAAPAASEEVVAPPLPATAAQQPAGGKRSVPLIVDSDDEAGEQQAGAPAPAPAAARAPAHAAAAVPVLPAAAAAPGAAPAAPAASAAQAPAMPAAAAAALSELEPESLETVAERFRAAGNRCFKDGDYEAAINLYAQGLSQLPDDDVILVNKALAHIK